VKEQRCERQVETRGCKSQALLTIVERLPFHIFLFFFFHLSPILIWIFFSFMFLSFTFLIIIPIMNTKDNGVNYDTPIFCKI